MYVIRDKLLPTRYLPHYGIMKKCFNEEELDRILFYEKILEFQPARTLKDLDEDKADQTYRICDMGHMPVDQNTEWLWQRLAELTAKANYDLFLYDIDFLESISFIVYYGSQGGKYDPHRDTSLHGYRQKDRKISGIVMLSDPDDYEGGKLKIDVEGSLNPESFADVELEKGDIVFFDSNFSHFVEPVTKGIRKVLVFWAWGDYKI